MQWFIERNCQKEPVSRKETDFPSLALSTYKIQKVNLSPNFFISVDETPSPPFFFFFFFFSNSTRCPCSQFTISMSGLIIECALSPNLDKSYQECTLRLVLLQFVKPQHLWRVAWNGLHYSFVGESHLPSKDTAYQTTLLYSKPPNIGHHITCSLVSKIIWWNVSETRSILSR